MAMAAAAIMPVAAPLDIVVVSGRGAAAMAWCLVCLVGPRRHDLGVEVLVRVARSLSANLADAEDLVQDTLRRAVRAIDTFEGRYPLRGC